MTRKEKCLKALREESEFLLFNGDLSRLDDINMLVRELVIEYITTQSDYIIHIDNIYGCSYDFPAGGEDVGKQILERYPNINFCTPNMKDGLLVYGSCEGMRGFIAIYETPKTDLRISHR